MPPPFSSSHPGYLEVTAGTHVPVTHWQRESQHFSAAMHSAIAYAETWPPLPAGPARNALHGLHTALPTARGR